MKANKVTVTITVEALSIDSVPAMLMQVANSIGDEFQTGTLRAADGDEVSWETKSVPVIF